MVTIFIYFFDFLGILYYLGVCMWLEWSKKIIGGLVFVVIFVIGLAIYLKQDDFRKSDQVNQLEKETYE